MAKREWPRTQRAWMEDDGDLRTDAFVRECLAERPDGAEGLTPVLVVPEAAVKNCKHDDTDGAVHDGRAWVTRAAWCSQCGAYRAQGGRWQRPRVLRVPR